MKNLIKRWFYRIVARIRESITHSAVRKPKPKPDPLWRVSGFHPDLGRPCKGGMTAEQAMAHKEYMESIGYTYVIMEPEA